MSDLKRPKASSDWLDTIPLSTDPTRSVGDLLTGFLKGTPDADGSTIPGMRNLAHDEISGKMSQTIHEDVFPPDERYKGPMTWAEFKTLQGQLEQLVFSIEQAQGQRPNRHLCRVCRRLGIVTTGSGSSSSNRFSDQTWLKWRPFGTWAALNIRAAHCIFCRLVLHSLSDGSRRRLHPRLEKIDPEVGTVQLYSERLPSSGEQYLAVEYGYRRAGAIRLVTQDNFSQVLRQAYQVPPGGETHDLLSNPGSPIRAVDGQCVSIPLIRSWLSDCDANHGAKCAGLQAMTARAQPAMGLFLIDVKDHRLVRATSAERYFALSYMWGDTQMPKTLRVNLADRMKPGSLLPEALPATIRDAMAFVSGLGERYLWIDVLCIVQDDPQQKHRDIKQMDLVYSCATATIVGLHGRNADAGLPGIRPGTRKPQVIETTTTTTTGSPAWLPGPTDEFVRHFNHLARTDKDQHETLVACRTIGAPLAETTRMMEWLLEALEPGGPGNPILDTSCLYKRPQGQGATSQSRELEVQASSFMAMVPHPPSLEYTLQCSSWDTRGWTFQERHLSTRCIFFSSDFVYFQCPESTRCETGGDLLPWPDITPATEFTSRAEALQKVETNPLLGLTSCAPPIPPPPPSAAEQHAGKANLPVLAPYEYKRHRFDVYRQIAEAYSRRHLSFASDMLNAFAGVAGVLERSFDSGFLSGLPACYLDHALLWAHETSWERRVVDDVVPPTSVSSPSLPGSDGDGRLLPATTKLFPSWSWAGWAGSIQYLLVSKGEGSYNRQNYEYAKSEIDCFQTFHAGVLHEVYKDKTRMEAAETRDFGSYGGNPLLGTYPVYLGYEERKTMNVSGPDLGPNALQFWTYAVEADAFAVEQLGPGYPIVDREHANKPSEQSVVRMLDGDQIHCGLMLAFHAEKKKKKEKATTTAWHGPTRGPLEWILISSFGNARHRRGGLQTVDTEVSPFDERKLPYEGEGSGLVNIMLVEWDNAVAERVTVAQIHRLAWEEAGPIRKHIRLV